MSALVTCPHCEGTGQVDLKAATTGILIRFHRERLRLQRRVLAKKAKTTVAKLTGIEEDSEPLTVDLLMRLSLALQLSPADLLPGSSWVQHQTESKAP